MNGGLVVMDWSMRPSVERWILSDIDIDFSIEDEELLEDELETNEVSEDEFEESTTNWEEPKDETETPSESEEEPSFDPGFSKDDEPQETQNDL